MKTKRNYLKITASVVLGLVFTSAVLTSCKKDDDAPIVSAKTITQVVVDDPNFSFLEAAVVKADLAATLSGTGPFTVFAPTNDAFKAAGFANEAAVSAASKETLQAILKYHVLGNNTTSAAIPTATNTEVATLNGANVYVTKNDKGVFVNGATVTKADVKASNGTIHVINKVLMPATGNIVAAAQGNANLSFLVAAVVKANLGTTLSGTGPFTVFAPTNAAFIAAGFPDVAAVSAASADVLTPILTYHVISGRVFSTDLSEGLMPTTVNGGKLSISLTGGAKVKGAGNSTAANITATDIVTTNGVVHVIDQVLKPAP
ncbi:MAG TPA: fasciclin domain-containing protein [Pelobium sp.]